MCARVCISMSMSTFASLSMCVPVSMSVLETVSMRDVFAGGLVGGWEWDLHGYLLSGALR